MTPTEALNLIDQATAQLSGTRQQHHLLQQAIATLRSVVQVQLSPSVSPVKPEAS